MNKRRISEKYLNKQLDFCQQQKNGAKETGKKQPQLNQIIIQSSVSCVFNLLSIG